MNKNTDEITIDLNLFDDEEAMELLLFLAKHDYLEDQLLKAAKNFAEDCTFVSKRYLVGDYELGLIDYPADDFLTQREAAQQFVNDGYWGEVESTLFLDIPVKTIYRFANVEVEDERSATTIRVEVEPEAPPCSSAYHDFQESKNIVSPIANGGGLIYKDACTHCGIIREINTWATDPNSGTQGEASVRYTKGT